jgi:MSHA biogenesis protein MshN
MCLINKMLQDLDRRQALGAGPEAGVLRAAPAAARHREWFWRTVTLLLTVGVAWVLWIAYQILPRPLVTDAAFRAAERARTRAPITVKVQAPVVPAVAEVAPVAPAAPKQAEEPLPAKQPPAAEALKLALAIETPVREPAAKPAAPAPRPKMAAPAAVSPPPSAAPAPTVAAPAPVAAAEKKASVDKRERNAPASAAEAHFRRAALLLSHGRVSEAEVELAAALKSDPGHVPARQAYVSLLLDQQRIAHARRLLEEALVENPTQPTFALALARVHAALRDYPKALEVLDRAGPAAAGAPEFQAMRGAVLQRLGRDDDAVRAFEDAIRGAPQPAATWVSLGISLEALGRRPEAADAYRKALAAGPLALEAREYAQDRMRALQ